MNFLSKLFGREKKSRDSRDHADRTSRKRTRATAKSKTKEEKEQARLLRKRVLAGRGSGLRWKSGGGIRTRSRIAHRRYAHVFRSHGMRVVEK